MRYSQARNPITNAPLAVRAQGITDVLPASVAERRVMKKVAQPEHAYTGCVPQTEEPEIDPLAVKRNPPILGYKGHLRNANDRFGMTFTHGLAVSTRAAEPVERKQSGRQHHDKRECPPHRVRFQQPPSPRQQTRHQSNVPKPAKPPMSVRSGYGEFDNASGYGEFAAPPSAMSKRSGYGEFDNASGYGEFVAPPSDNQSPSPQPRTHTRFPASAPALRLTYSESLDKKYQQALKNAGGRACVLKLWSAAAVTISCRHRKRTELLQTIKRSFERREAENCGRMTREHLKEALQSLACVFTDDQVTALFGLYDTQCKGTVSMDTLLLALTDCL